MVEFCSSWPKVSVSLGWDGKNTHAELSVSPYRLWPEQESRRYRTARPLSSAKPSELKVNLRHHHQRAAVDQLWFVSPYFSPPCLLQAL